MYLPSHVIVTELFLVKLEIHPTYPSVDEWIRKTCCMCKMNWECSSVVQSMHNIHKVESPVQSVNVKNEKMSFSEKTGHISKLDSQKCYFFSLIDSRFNF